MTNAPGRRSAFANIFIVSSGNFLAMYDFMVFGYYAKAIGRTFFPTSSEFGSLMLALMTFGAGFLMRPVGALVLGAYIDRNGRRKGLLLTLALMGAGTLTIALMPGYAQIGLLAPVLILVGRLVQGLSAGVEVGGVSVYLSEIATLGRRGFYVAWQSASQQVAVMFAALVGLLLNGFLSPDQVSGGGWRIPFLIGSLMVPFLFVIRRLLEESPAFDASGPRPSFGALYRSIATNLSVVLAGMFTAVMTTVFFYMITAYTPTYGNSVLHLSAAGAMLVTLCVGATNFVMLPLMGAVSDRVGRRPLLIGAALAAVLTGYPALWWLVSEPSLARLLTVELWLAVVYATYNGAMIVHLTEIMPLQVRTAGFSLSYSLATAIFGGFTPALATWLIAQTGDRAIPGAWLSLAAAVSLAAVLLTRKARA
jgi:MFS transporter, MHS family, citrate/tricarballylate:H+ symporter